MIKKFFNDFDLKKKLKKSILGRGDILKPWMQGRSFLVHNGKELKKLQVVRLRLETKAGDYIRTRKFPVHKKKVRYYNV